MRICIGTILISLFFIQFIVSSVSSQESLKLCGIEGSVNHRIGSAILQNAYEKIGISVQTVGFPGKRSLVMSNVGDCDGEVQRIDNINQHYPNLLKVSEPIIYLESSVFVKDSTINVDGWESLSSYLIGVPRGIVYLDHYTQGMNRIFVNKLDQLFHLLDIGRIDAVIISKNYGQDFIKKHNMNIYMVEPPILRIPLYHYLHIKHETLLPQINQTLEAMRADGTIDNISEQHSNSQKAH